MQIELVRHIESPIGRLALCADGDGLCALRFAATGEEMDAAPVLMQAERELEEYFAGRRTAFSVPLSMHGTPFQTEVWAALRTIPYGETRSYASLAAQIGRPRACRAVGMANHVNPMPILVPCHRVLGADGRLTGYAGGLDVKKYLLELEGVHVKV